MEGRIVYFVTINVDGTDAISITATNVPSPFSTQVEVSSDGGASWTVYESDLVYPSDYPVPGVGFELARVRVEGGPADQLLSNTVEPP